AIVYYNKALHFQDCTGNQKCRANILISLGNIYSARGEKSEAIKCYKEALKICNNIEFKAGEQVILENLNKLNSI
ncbi:MAG: tetratricopeptide repeat protein, partial [Clostridiaceae bacterium]